MPELTTIEEWMPVPPDMGPPLPRWLAIYWPWHKWELAYAVEYPEEITILPSPVEAATNVKVIAVAALIRTPEEIGASNPGIVYQGTYTPTLERMGWTINWWGNKKTLSAWAVLGGEGRVHELPKIDYAAYHQFELEIMGRRLVFKIDGKRVLYFIGKGPLQRTLGEPLEVNFGGDWSIQSLKVYSL